MRIPSKFKPRENGLLSRLVKAGHPFVRRNANVLAILAGLFILIEGSTAVFYTSQWWKPLAVLAVIGVVALAWVNIRAVFKAVISAAITVMLAAGSIIAGYYYSASTGAGSAWGMVIIMVWVACIAISYWFPTSRSRWFTSLVSSVVAFLASYAVLMSTGTMSMVMMAAVIAGMAAFAVMMVLDMMHRNSRKSLNVADYDHKRIHGMMRKIMPSLWPGMTESIVSFGRKRKTWLWHGVGSPAVLLVPVDLNEELEPSKKGLTYHGRDTGRNLNWMLSKTETLLRKVVPIVVLIDLKSMNKATAEEASLITVPRLDSNRVSYVGIMGADGSADSVKRRLAGCVARFSGYDLVDGKTDRKLTKRFDDRPLRIDMNKYRFRRKDGGK